MKKKQRSLLLIVILSVTIGAGSSSLLADGNTFVDVPSGHWSAEAISWGVKNNVFSGYGNGRFEPNKHVTEAEFLKMIITAYVTPPAQGKNWYDRYYAFAYEHRWHVNGLRNADEVNQPLLRKDAAIILASALGNRYYDDGDGSSQSAIHELYKRELSNGKTSKTIDGFAPDEKLSRAEAALFIYTFVKNSGIETLTPNVIDADWATYEKVGFDDGQALLDKHKLFAKKYGLQTVSYESAGWQYIVLMDDTDVQGQDTTERKHHFSSAYMIEEDGTVQWTVGVNLDKLDAEIGYEFVARILSFNSVFSDSVQLKLLPTAQELGMKIDGRLEARFDHLEMFALYDRESHFYYFISSIVQQPAGGDVE